MMKDFDEHLSKIEKEKEVIRLEKEEWIREKGRIMQIQPVEDIVKLNVGGKEDFHVRKSTLCHVQGSALEAMFSGRHNL